MTPPPLPPAGPSLAPTAGPVRATGAPPPSLRRAEPDPQHTPVTPTAVICGIGACLPQRSVSNQELAHRLHIPAETIHDLTGIRRRRIAEPGTSTGDLAVLAGQAALTSAATASDFLLLATSTPDRPIPATAPEVAHRLNLGDIPALDVGAGCPGFLYALTLARALITSGICSRPLVIGADVMSSVLDPLDPTTSMVFGDGAGAVLLGQGPSTQPGAICATDLGSDGSGSDLITILAGGSRHPLRDGQPLPPAQHCLREQGPEAFTHAVTRMTASSRHVLDRAGWPTRSVHAFLGQQANTHLLTTVADHLGITAPSCFGNIADVGNTSAASLPLAIADTAARQAVPPGTRTLLTTFGAGLTWGSAALTWPDTKPLLVESG